MATIERFEDVQAWQKARGLVREIYQACAASRLSRDFGLKDQLCRAAVSSMSNVFERLYQVADETASLIGGFTSYLRKRLRTQTPNS